MNLTTSKGHEIRVGDRIQINGGKHFEVLTVWPSKVTIRYWHWWDRAGNWLYAKFYGLYYWHIIPMLDKARALLSNHG